MKKMLNFLSVVFLFIACMPLASAQLVQNPLLFPSTSLVAGNCLQSTGPNSVGTTAAPCGAGSGTVSGPSSSTVNDVAAFSNATGTGLLDSGVQFSVLARTNTSNTFNANQTVTGSNDPLLTLLAGTGETVSLYNAHGSGTPNYGLVNNGTGHNAYSCSYATDACTFYARPVFGANTPLDSANYGTYALPLSGGTLTGAVNNAIPNPGGWSSSNPPPTSITAQGSLTSNWAVVVEPGNSIPSQSSYLEAITTGGVDVRFYARDADTSYGLLNHTTNVSALSFNKTSDIGTFAYRPIFGTATPWDSANLGNPATGPTTVTSGDLVAFNNSAGNQLYDTGIGFGNVALINTSNTFQGNQSIVGSSNTYLLIKNSNNQSIQTFVTTGSGTPLYGWYNAGTAHNSLTCLYNTDVCTFYATPAAPTASAGDNSTKLATTAFVAGLGVNANVTLNSLTGTTAGSVKWSQPVTGSAYKLTSLNFAGYQNTGGTAQTITFTTPYTTGSTPVAFGSSFCSSLTVSTTSVSLPTLMILGADSGVCLIAGY